MTQIQGWIVIALVAFIAGFPIYERQASKPSEASLALKEHYRQKCFVTGDCTDYDRTK